MIGSSRRTTAVSPFLDRAYAALHVFAGRGLARTTARFIGTTCIITTTMTTAASPAMAGEPSPTRAYTIEQVVAEALANHPRLHGSAAEELAADARIDEASTQRLPDVGVSAQINRSTANTVPGAFVPSTGFVPIAGPTRGKTFDDGFWQTGASLWATWDALSLMRQAAVIDVALAGRSEAAAISSAQRLEVAYRAADAFILLVESEETVRAARASIERAQVLSTITKSLVDQSLRPGADWARAEAELASGRTALARAEQSRDIRQSQLVEAMGGTGAGITAASSDNTTRSTPSTNTEARIEPTAGGLLGPIDDIAARASSAPSAAPPPVVSPNHPDVVAANAAIERASRARRLVDVEYLPRIDLVAALWARGSGAFQSPASGLVPDTPNWIAGVNVTWSFLDIPTVRARSRVAAATHDVAIARRDEIGVSVAGQLRTSSAVLRGSINVARQTPSTLLSARTAEQQASARFKTGLSTIVDVADAQRVLAQAEIDDAVARLEVRRALLLLARASGDLGPFFAQTRGSSSTAPSPTPLPPPPPPPPPVGGP